MVEDYAYLVEFFYQLVEPCRTLEGMRSYGQYCSVARALDIVGDRWTLLIIRELLLQGPCRFTDLKNGLPGIAANLLSTRLKELEAAGLTEREDAPPPIATTLYQLTETGHSLEPVIKSLALWGLKFMKEERPGDEFRPQWLFLDWFTVDAEPQSPPAAIQLITADQLAVIELRDGQPRTRPGRVPKPDLTLEGPPRTLLGLLTGLVDLQTARRIGITATGDTRLLARLQPAVPG